MSTIDLIGLIGSIITIATFISSMFLKSNSNANFKVNSNFNKSLNSNSFNKTINTYNYSVEYKNNFNTPKNNNEDSMKIFCVVFLICGGFLIKFYLDYKSTIIGYLILLCILCFIINILLVIYSIKKFTVSTFCIFNNLFKWFFMFINFIFINHPYYYSSTLEKTQRMIMNKHNFIEIFLNNTSAEYSAQAKAWQVLLLSILFLTLT
ncbi:hypothetical protein [Clostridium botulinum]|uniref:hypothetical protein n=1 Tax=Clostridium botulinum TaxID=1491 RepID=UPI0004D4C342|nr:hypothetical protein [Clostridium botulinum]KEH99803.1 hypothetical protein Z952_p0130 [Clostridium botulinum C/D str. BKT75002]KEI05281.1 hypothetical protein Z954_0131 [Clostridium botulinum C/D str. BKT2873]QPW61971.1 hypothetical protein IG390_14035 [Clostridium botulinum]